VTDREGDSWAQGRKVCPAEHAGWLSSPWRKVVHSPRRILRRLAKPGDTVVDLGCGPGFFSLPLAEMVGDAGRVIAVDLQEEMLDKLRFRAEHACLASRIQLHRCTPTTIGLVAEADFVLAFYMLHEVPDKERFLGEVRGILKEGGRFLLVEPWGEVPAAHYRRSVAAAVGVGFRSLSNVHVAFSRATLFQRA
jgi:ubiquinone/menaquinone biosynthesis C-methylase UbiE